MPRRMEMGKKTCKYIWLFFLAVLFLTGCVSRIQKTEKLQDLSFTVLDKEAVPEELKAVSYTHLFPTLPEIPITLTSRERR